MPQTVAGGNNKLTKAATIFYSSLQMLKFQSCFCWFDELRLLPLF